MKKLIFIFIALFAVVLISGCGTRENTVRFDENGETTTDTEEAENTDSSETTSKPTKLEVTSFDGAHKETNLRYNIVRGTVPAGTHSIKINDYSLQKFIPGQTEWSYIASTSLSTLEPGWNNYITKSFDAQGNETGSIIFSLDYKTPAVAELPDVGASHWLLLIFSMILSGTYFVIRRYFAL